MGRKLSGNLLLYFDIAGVVFLEHLPLLRVMGREIPISIVIFGGRPVRFAEVSYQGLPLFHLLRLESKGFSCPF